MAGLGVLLATFCAIILTSASTASARVFFQTFPKFTAIQTTLAFDGNLVPAPDGKTYDVSLTGPTRVIDAFQPTVTSSGPLTLLTIGLKPNTNIAVSEAVNYTIRMPQKMLQALSTTGSGAFEADGQVINSGVPTFTLSASGAALTSVVDFPSVPVSIKTAGSGSTLIEGSEVPSATVASTGSGETFLGFATGPVNIALAGSGSAYIATGGSEALSVVFP